MSLVEHLPQVISNKHLIICQRLSNKHVDFCLELSNNHLIFATNDQISILFLDADYQLKRFWYLHTLVKSFLTCMHNYLMALEA